MAPCSDGGGGLQYLCNAEFDLSLRRTWNGDEVPERYLAEMSCQWVAAGGPGDAVRVCRHVPLEFLETLAEAGLDPPQLISDDTIRSDLPLRPLGWNQRAIDLNRHQQHPIQHPSFEAVQQANSKAFSVAVEHDVAPAAVTVHPSATVHTIDDLERLLANAPTCPRAWVVKAVHGNAALANRKIDQRPLSDPVRRQIQSWLEEDGMVILEPWLNRSADLCTTFQVTRDGSVSAVEIHEALHTAGGGFIGAVYGSTSGALPRWCGPLREAASGIGRHLAAVGYFGPVCVDSIVHLEGGQERLRAVVDINAREQVSLVAQRLHRRIGRDRCILWRFYPSSRIRLPPRPDQEALGALAFRQSSRTGILVTSPPWTRAPDGGLQRCRKVSILIAARDRREAFAIEEAFRTSRWRR